MGAGEAGEHYIVVPGSASLVYSIVASVDNDQKLRLQQQKQAIHPCRLVISRGPGRGAFKLIYNPA